MTQSLGPRRSGPQPPPGPPLPGLRRGGAVPPPLLGVSRGTPAKGFPRWLPWAAAGGGLALTFVVGLIVLLCQPRSPGVTAKTQPAKNSAARPASQTPSSAVPDLVLEWPAEERGWAKVTIDGQEQKLPPIGALRYPLPPRATPYAIALTRPGYDTLQFSVTSAADRPLAPYRVQWKAAGSDDMLTLDAVAGTADNAAFDDWLQDFEKAKQTAAAEGKKILLLFVGSDWGKASQRLINEVCLQPDFKPQVGKDFVLVWVDFPKGAPAESRVQNAVRNARLRQDFQITSLPTVLLTNAQGRPFGKLGNAAGGLEGFLSMLDRRKIAGQDLERAIARLAASTEKEPRQQALEDLRELLRQHRIAQYYPEFDASSGPPAEVAMRQKPPPAEEPTPAAKVPVPPEKTPPPAASAPQPVQAEKLVGLRVDLTLANGETLSNRQVVRIAQGKEANTIVSVTLADDGSGKPKPLGAVRIREVSMPGGRPLFVYDLVRKALVPPEQLTKLRSPGKAGGAPAEGDKPATESLATKSPQGDGGEKVTRGRWPELSDEAQRQAVEKQRGHLTQIEQGVPHVGLRLYETKRFLFFSDIQAQLVNTIYVPYLDQMYTQLCAAYGIDPGQNIWKGKATIIAFAQQRSFHQFEATFYEPLPDENIRGLAHLRGEGTVLISCYAFDSPTTLGGIMVHETVHGFNFRHRSPRQLPSWLDEGIAEWVSDRVVPGNQSVRRKVEAALQQMRSTRDLGGTYFSADHIDGWQYGVAASMTDFLLKYSPAPQAASRPSSRNRQAKQEPLYFRKFIEAIKDGTPWPDALRQTYGLSVPGLAQSYGQVIGVPDLRL